MPIPRHPRRALLLVTWLAAVVTTRAWDYEGHRMINELALATLPADFPAFVREPANAERIAFLAGEPDRWKNNPDLPTKHSNSIDHYLDVEQLAAAGLSAATLTPLRYDFAAQFATARAAHPERFPAIDPAKNTDRTREWTGFLPWTITEHYGRLKAAFSYLKTFEEAGTSEEIANAKANIVHLMGLLGHYVGDGAQPLHTTRHHNGWVGDNPRQYTTWPGFHSWIDSGFINRAGIKTADMRSRVTPVQPLALPAQADGRDPAFVAVVDYLLATHQLVEPLYAMEKNEVLKADTATNSPEGRAFFEARLLAGGQMLGTLWLTAWKQAAPDTFLKAQLLKRSIATPANSTP